MRRQSAWSSLSAARVKVRTVLLSTTVRAEVGQQSIKVAAFEGDRSEQAAAQSSNQSYPTRWALRFGASGAADRVWEGESMLDWQKTAKDDLFR